MKKINNIPNLTQEDLEEKIVELSFKNKSLLREVEELKKTNNQLLRKLVHNLKNPVGASFSFSEMLLENINSFDVAKIHKYLSVIKDASAHSIEILNSVGKLNQVKSPEFELNKTEENYSEFLQETINQFNTSETNFETEIPKNISFKFDKIELKFAISQIINNAIRYNNSTTPKIEIKVEKTNQIVETTFSDNGIGIEKENIPLVFKEFFVENTYDSNRKKCLGLGLSISRKIIEMHNGTILITKNNLEGISVKISIPI